MARKNRKCLACQVKYSFCPDCSKADALQPSWKAEFCSESCMTLWSTLTKFGMNKLTKSEAKEIISALNLKPMETYAACVQRDYKKVMESEKKSRRVKPIIIEAPAIEQVETIIAEEVPVIVEQAHEVVNQENE